MPSLELDQGKYAKGWPTPIVDAIEQLAAETGHKYAAWGHRKIWAMLRTDGVRVSISSVERALRRASLLQPRRYQAERRQLARARRETFIDPPTRRNRVWQADFTEFETSRGGTWRISIVVDYATKVRLAAAVTGTSAARDAILVRCGLPAPPGPPWQPFDRSLGVLLRRANLAA
jgi:transposase InsO family protein